jgi:hypothetical protein
LLLDFLVAIKVYQGFAGFLEHKLSSFNGNQIKAIIILFFQFKRLLNDVKKLQRRSAVYV